MADHFLAVQMEGAALQLPSRLVILFYFLCVFGYAASPLLNTSLAGLGPQLPFSNPHTVSSLPRGPTQFAPPTFLTFLPPKGLTIGPLNLTHCL